MKSGEIWIAKNNVLDWSSNHPPIKVEKVKILRLIKNVYETVLFEILGDKDLNSELSKNRNSSLTRETFLKGFKKVY